MREHLVPKRKFLVSLELSATAELKQLIHLELFQFPTLCSYEAICPIQSTILEIERGVAIRCLAELISAEQSSL